MRCQAARLILILIWAATATARGSAWFARPWQSNDGLPNDTITGLAQTPDGYLWITTPVGLARFDGVHFEEYSHTNYIAEPNRGVIALVRSGPNTLWLAMDRGPIVRLNAGTAKVFSATNGLPDRTVQRMIDDGDGGIWASYRNGTIYRINHDKIISFGRAEGVPRATAFALTMDSKGRLWMAEERQLFLLRDSRFEKIPSTPARSSSAQVAPMVPCRRPAM